MMNICGHCNMENMRYAEECFWCEERLGPSRSGAESGCAAAERCAPDEAEGRSREGGRVAPGKAKEAIAYCEDMAARRQTQSDDDHKKSRFVDAMLNSGEAAGWRGAAAVLTSIFFPADEPDSEAPQERSGRRNAERTGGTSGPVNGSDL